jgi:MFS family permease
MSTDTAAQLARKVLWRLAAPLIVFMLLSSVDRVNVSFAAIKMNRDLGFTPAQYGFGAGILFVGFLAGQYPSVLAQQRWGMRRWMGLSAVVWGLCAGAMAFVRTPFEFYALRVLLGFVEGGIAPGIVFYLSQFATERERATTFALPMVAVPLSVVVGGPLSGWLMQQQGLFGLAEWRWMFIVEAVPTVLLGLASFAYFPDTPDEAAWLARAEREWLAANAANRREVRVANDWRVLRRPLVWACALLWFCLLSGSYGIMFWLPQIVSQLSGLGPLEVGLVTALPWFGNIFGIYFNSRHSDRTGERFWHVAVPAAITAVGLLAAAALGATIAGLAALTIAGTALGAAQGAFWALPTRSFTPATFAVGAVAINIGGSAGGLVMPWLVGLVKAASPSAWGPSLLIAAALGVAFIIVLAIRAREAASPTG